MESRLRMQTNVAEVAPWPFFDFDEIEAAQNVLQSGKVNYWTGTEGREFEKEFASYLGAKHAIAVANGTVSIQMAVNALGLQPGDEFITTPRTFIATASACILHGLKPVFADVDRDSGNITAESIDRVITSKTKMILPVHLGGWPCEMNEIMALALQHNLYVVEDCAQAHGAELGGRAVGTFGQIGSWSFCQDKIMTVGGEGGLLNTNDSDLWNAMWSYKDHGKSWESVYVKQHPPGYRWVHEGWGTNYRLTEFQSAIGRKQLKKLDTWIEQRTRNAEILMEHLASSSALRIPVPPSNMKSAYYRLYAYLDPKALKPGWTRDSLMQAISSCGAPCFVGSCGEIYREGAFVSSGLGPSEPLPVARELGETSLAFLVHPTFTESDLHRIAEVALGVLNEAVR